MSSPQELEQMRAAADKAMEGARLLDNADFEGSIIACDEATRIYPCQLGAWRTREEALRRLLARTNGISGYIGGYPLIRPRERPPTITKEYTYWVYFDESSAEPQSWNLFATGDPFIGVNQAIVLRYLPDHELEVRGYYDAEREDESVGKRRAEVVYDYILDHDNVGSRPHRISWEGIEGHGQEDRGYCRFVKVHFYNPKAQQYLDELKNRPPLQPRRQTENPKSSLFKSISKFFRPGN